MSDPIQTYHDLLEERKRLEAQLALQKESMKASLSSLRQELKPALSVVSFLGSMLSREAVNPVIGTAANTVIDLVLKNTLLGRSGWLVRNIVPALVKNLSSHYIADREHSILGKLYSLVGLKRKKTSQKNSQQKTDGEL